MFSISDNVWYVVYIVSFNPQNDSTMYIILLHHFTAESSYYDKIVQFYKDWNLVEVLPLQIASSQVWE